MRVSLLLSILISLFCQTVFAQGFAGDNYRRYTGTIDGKQVVANIHWGNRCEGCGFEWTGGSNYYYVGDESGWRRLAMVGGQNDLATIYEGDAAYPEKWNKSGELSDSRKYIWECSFENGKITGTRKNKDGVTTVIDLQENYTNAYAFNTVRLYDTVKLQNNEGEAFYANLYLAAVTPAGEVTDYDATFIRDCILNYANDEGLSVEDWNNYPEESQKEFFAQMKANASSLKVDVEEEKNTRDLFREHADFFIRHQRTTRKMLFLFPVYNSNGLIVFEGSKNQSGQMVEKIETGHEHICVDVAQRKIWTVEDILTTGAELEQIIEQNARKRFSIKDGEPLSAPFTVANIPATNNVMIADNGLYFCYTPGTIADKEDEEFRFFITYKELSALLTEPFKARMGLN